eukprot:CAMPEP_0178934864 /NCGR_PEP_ID=MMETSP0786-20121207/24157_1 /TAXON_ID=186022 /ORGANISM="Thalassionema frauenfeldii, Strain CCMP 1798" /LENGTH=354 /DNA_ID=CAMNT_0020612809 /DNA_START=16 /DNA_END=1080 /DNA_ORIENTATION=-
MLSDLVYNRNCWQYWVIHFFPILVIFFAFILGAVSTDACDFMLVEWGRIGNNVPVKRISRFGLFRMWESGSQTDTCGTWSFRNSLIKSLDLELDNEFITDITADLNSYYTKIPGGGLIAAQAFAVMACILGITSIILLFLSFYFPFSKLWFGIVIPAVTITAGVFQLFTFCIFAADNCKSMNTNITTHCSLLQAGRVSICAALMYLGMGVGLIFYPKLAQPLLAQEDDDENHKDAVAPSLEEIQDLMEEGSVEPAPEPPSTPVARAISIDEDATAAGKPEAPGSSSPPNSGNLKPDPVCSFDDDVPADEQAMPEEDPQVKTTMLQDGSRRVEKVVRNPDGSKTTTITTEQFDAY